MTDTVECLRKQGKHDIADEIERLRAELQEASRLLLRMQKERLLRDVKEAFAAGTLARPAEDEPSSYTHNLLPTAPPHDK